jgi:hypothetical protein
MKLTHRLAQLDAEAENAGIHARGIDDAPELAVDDEDDTIEPVIPGAGISAEEVVKML